MSLCLRDQEEFEKRKERIRKLLKDQEEINEILKKREDVSIMLS